MSKKETKNDFVGNFLLILFMAALVFNVGDMIFNGIATSKNNKSYDEKVNAFALQYQTLFKKVSADSAEVYMSENVQKFADQKTAVIDYIPVKQSDSIHFLEDAHQAVKDNRQPVFDKDQKHIGFAYLKKRTP